MVRNSVLLVFLVPAFACAAPYTAVVVGCDTYGGEFANLRYAVSDAEKVAEGLRQIGYQVTECGDGSSAEQVLDAVRKSAAATDAGGTFLFFFAGHGLESAGEAYLAIGAKSRLKLSGDEPNSLYRAAETKANRVFVLDACRTPSTRGGTTGMNGGLTSGFVTRSVAVGTAPASPGLTAILFACSEREAALEDSALKGGVFTHYFTEALTGPGADRTLGKLTMAAMLSYVSSQVAFRQEQQHPWMQGAGSILLGEPKDKSKIGLSEYQAKIAEGIERYNAKKYNQAAKAFLAAFEIDESAECAYWIGRCNRKFVDYEQARRWITRCLGLDNGMTRANIEAGHIDFFEALSLMNSDPRRAQGLFQDAQNRYAAAHALDKENEDALIGWGYACRNAGWLKYLAELDKDKPDYIRAERNYILAAAQSVDACFHVLRQNQKSRAAWYALLERRFDSFFRYIYSGVSDVDRDLLLAQDFLLWAKQGSLLKAALAILTEKEVAEAAGLKPEEVREMTKDAKPLDLDSWVNPKPPKKDTSEPAKPGDKKPGAADR